MATIRGDAIAQAVQALIVLAEAQRGMATSEEIADVIGAHAVVVRRSLGMLRAEGIVESRRGPNGGWALARDPATISLARIYSIMAGEPVAVTPAALDEALVGARDASLAHLERISLASLLAT